jgi:hypothetical protein
MLGVDIPESGAPPAAERFPIRAFAQSTYATTEPGISPDCLRTQILLSGQPSDRRLGHRLRRQRSCRVRPALGEKRDSQFEPRDGGSRACAAGLQRPNTRPRFSGAS